MKRKPYKANKRGTGRHVQLHEWVQATEAWATLKPGPRALYIELKRRFNGSNNGEIFLSHRDAAKALNINRNTATGYFAELLDHRFITMTQGPHLGPSGIGLASKWALQEDKTSDGRPASKGFVAWRQKQNPRPKKGTPRPNKRDSSPTIHPELPSAVPRIGTQTAMN